MRFVNAAAKVADLDAALATLTALPGVSGGRLLELDGGSFAEVTLGETTLYLFTEAMYEPLRAAPMPEGLLHVVFAVDDLDAALAGGGWSEHVLQGPVEIAGSFGRRRIVFCEPLPGLVVELMEDLADAS